MPACAVKSVNVTGPDGRAGAETDCNGDAGCGCFAVSVEGSGDGCADFDLQPAIVIGKSIRHSARDNRDLAFDAVWAVLAWDWVNIGSMIGWPPGLMLPLLRLCERVGNQSPFQ